MTRSIVHEVIGMYKKLHTILGVLPKTINTKDNFLSQDGSKTHKTIYKSYLIVLQQVLSKRYKYDAVPRSQHGFRGKGLCGLVSIQKTRTREGEVQNNSVGLSNLKAVRNRCSTHSRIMGAISHRRKACCTDNDPWKEGPELSNFCPESSRRWRGRTVARVRGRQGHATHVRVDAEHGNDLAEEEHLGTAGRSVEHLILWNGTHPVLRRGGSEVEVHIVDEPIHIR
ncbi:hypothetical protein BKA93DRAFT_751679 [Sparassis latifolia]